MGNSTHTASIHILDDDSLLYLFYLYRPFTSDEDEDYTRIMGGNWQWAGERWWYKLAHVCQRWRNLILGSASYLDLSLVCSEGTPVANMLAHSPPLPLVIDYDVDEDRDITTEDEEGMIFALKQRDRVRRVRLLMPVTILRRLIVVIDEEYPILEYIVVAPQSQIEDTSPFLTFPETFQAPHLRHLTITGFTLPIGSRLLTAAVSLVTLCLVMENPYTHLDPNTLHRWLSFMPQLETLVIFFVSANPNRERQLTHTPITAPITLPNLRHFMFKGVSDDLEALVHQIIIPRLEKLQIRFFHRFTFSVPRLLEFMNTTENLSLDSAKFEFFRNQVNMEVYPCGETKTYTLSVIVHCKGLDWQVSSMAQISNSLSPMFSAVKNLTLNYRRNSPSYRVDRTEWYKFFSSFNGVRTLCVDDGLVEELSRCLRSDNNNEFLPELQELTYSWSGDTGDPFTSFIDARQNAGRPVTLVRCSPGSDPSPSSVIL
jgi:hypothetical protein